MPVFTLGAYLLVAAMMIAPVVAAFGAPPKSHEQPAQHRDEAEAAA